MPPISTFVLNTQIKGFFFRQIIEGCRKKQQLAEEREKAMRDKRGRLMERVQCVEDELNLALKHRQVTLAEIM